MVDKEKAQELLKQNKEREKQERLAKACTSSIASAAKTFHCFMAKPAGVKDAQKSLRAFNNKMTESSKDTATFSSKVLLSQALVLDAVFNDMLRKAYASQGRINIMEPYMKLAFKDQTQSRQALEAVAEIKNPRMVHITKQDNSASGNQQVNNYTREEKQKDSKRTIEEDAYDNKTTKQQRMELRETGEAIETHAPPQAMGRKSTGPRTVEGKAIASRNVDKGRGEEVEALRVWMRGLWR